MQTGATTDIGAMAPSAGGRVSRARWVLALATALAVAAGATVVAAGDGAAHDPDFVRLMRFMAAMKGGFALAALAACFWRLGRPAVAWRRVAYVAGPPLIGVGAAGLWALRDPGFFALGLHLGLFAVLAAALTDPDFVPDILPLHRTRRWMRRPAGRAPPVSAPTSPRM
jgi:hypothetical protein